MPAETGLPRLSPVVFRHYGAAPEASVTLPPAVGPVIPAPQDILLNGPFALSARDDRGQAALRIAIASNSANSRERYDDSPPTSLGRIESESPKVHQLLSRSIVEVPTTGLPPAERGYNDRPTFDRCGAEFDATWSAYRDLDRIRSRLHSIPLQIENLKRQIAQIEAEGPWAAVPKLSPPKPKDPLWKWVLNAADNAYKISKFQTERNDIDAVKQEKTELLRRQMDELGQEFEKAERELSSAEKEAAYRSHMQSRCNDIREPK